MERILCLIDSLGTGGAERQIMGLAQLLKIKGYKVDLVTYIPHNFHDVLSEKYGLTSTSLCPNPTRWSKIKAVKQYIKTNQYDVVISYKDGANVIACILKMLGMKFRLIVSERNTTQTITRYQKVKFFTYRFAEYVVPNSYSQKRFIASNFSYLLKKTRTITNYTDIDLFHPVERKENDVLQILTVARFGKQKNVRKYIEVVRKLKEDGIIIKFLWYGNVQINEDDYHDECIDLVKSYGIDDTISFMPGTNDIYEVYHQSDIFCLPSIYEGYPNVVCEAMCSGMPILCGDVCDNSTIIEDGVNGYLFDPNNIDDMVDKIKRITLLSTEERRMMGFQSRRIAESKFSKDIFISKYIELIEG